MIRVWMTSGVAAIAMIVAGPALIAPSAAAQPAAASVRAKAHPHKKAHKANACHEGRVRVRVGRRTACIKPARRTSDAAAQQRAADRGLLASRLRPRGRHGHGRTVRGWLGSSRKGLTAVERALAKALQARSVAADRSAGANPRSTKPAAAKAKGWKTTVTDRAADGDVGTLLDLVSRHGHAKISLKLRDTVKAEHCPDAAGVVPGTRTRSATLKLEVPLSHGHRLVVTSSQSTGAPFTATTNDQAALARLVIGRMKTSAKTAGEVRDHAGHVIAILSGRNLHATATIAPVGLGSGWAPLLTDPRTAFVASSALNGILHGGTSSLDPLLRSFVAGMQTDAWRTEDVVRRALQDEQDTWWQGGRCVKLDLYTPGPTKLRPGGHADVRATLLLQNPPKHPKSAGIAAAALTPTVTGGGTIAPTAATTKAATGAQADPVTFAYTAPGQKAAPTVFMTATSRQGVASAARVDFLVQGDYRLVYTHTSVGSFDFPFSHYGTQDASGRLAEQHDLALAATAPLTVAADGTTATGSGPLTWQRQTWATDDDSTERTGQDPRIYCHLDTKQEIIATTSGTMTVNALTLGPDGPDGTPTIAALDVTLAGATDTWGTTETGECPRPNPDYQYNRYMSTMVGYYGKQSARGVQARYIPADPPNPYGPGGVDLKLARPWDGGDLTIRLPPPDYDEQLPPGTPLIPWTDSFKLVPVG